MDHRAAKEYATFLKRELSRENGAWDDLIFIPLIGLATYFAFGGIAGFVVGAMIGYAIGAVLARLRRIERTQYLIAFQRLLHEQTDAVSEGTELAEIQESVERATRWRIWK